ncbi:putative ABC transport system permease protein [Devosia subaequoris]|uniref:Putative ABC transport system permease protein n=1 Tax=Devosia subaequoris TaxID=395930 RepID=A0A7W6IKJ4_9HYPH|nr:FtsX-like permease family protein [Devosia subaequoris]MBB4051345.1 putative ABC transport system permease protein [Devosia subaequoris]MCP1208942.1 FtsX-like permease family protein [Devosia subaequoris]
MRRLQGWLRVALIDLRGSARRFVILIACLALGVAAIGTVSAVRSSVEAAIERDARLILGGDLELRSQRSDVDDQVVAALDALGRVSREVELNSQATANGKSAFLSLRAVTDAYPLVGEVGLAAGAQVGSLANLLAERDGTFGVLLAQQAALRLDVQVGETVRIGVLEIELRGIIAALPDQATAGFQLGAPALISSAALAPAGLREAGVLSQFRYKVLLADGDFEAAQIALEEAFPDKDWQIRSPRQATATIARFIGVFGNFMLLVALSSMVVGGLGAANAVAAYVGERQGAIATMRSLGAKRGRILFHFLVQIALLSLIAIGIGMVIVAGATLALLPLLSVLIGIDLPPVLDFRSMLVAGAIGLVTALFFSWGPLLQARAVRPALLFRAGSSSAMEGLAWRAMLKLGFVAPLLVGFVFLFGLTLLIANDLRLVAIYFAGTLVAFALLRAAAALLRRFLSRVPVPRQRLLRQAISAIVRPGAPTTTVLVSMGMGLSLLLLIVTTQSNINDQIATEVSAEAPDFVLLDMDRDELTALEAFVAQTPQIEALTTIPMLRGVITDLNGDPAPSSDDAPREVADMFRGDTALTWSATVPPGTVIEDGDWWTEDYAGDPQVSLSTEMQDALNLELGDTITLSIAGRPLTMTIASFRTIDWRSPDFNFRIIVSPGLIESAPQSYFGTIKASPGAAFAIEAGLIATLPQLTFVPVGDALARLQSVFDGLISAIALVSGTAVIAGVLVLAGALSVGRQQREADAVVMKVLGARRGLVIVAFLIEYALLGAIAAILASLIALTAAWAASTFLLEIGFAVQPLQLGMLAAGIIIVTTATGAATTWSAMSARPADRLREDG